jgi:D-aminoacyl-tRNA deacylase
MKALIQRVKEAKVTINNKVSGEIKKGLLIFLAIRKDDDENEAFYLASKIFNLRVFEDEKSKFNLSLLDVSGEVLVISQFTLHGNCRKGRRPSFDKAASGEHAEKLYHFFIKECEKYKNIKVATGIFGAKMDVQLINDGPVTFMVESTNEFE